MKRLKSTFLIVVLLIGNINIQGQEIFDAIIKIDIAKVKQFTYENGTQDIYWVSTKFIKEMRPKN